MAKRFYGFTWNYPDAEEDHYMIEINSYANTIKYTWVNKDELSFIAFQGERGKENGRLHLQGMVCFKEPHRITGLKKIFFSDIEKNIHWHVWDTRQNCYEYCTKEDTRSDFISWEWGNLDSQGKSHEWETVQTALDTGVNYTTVAQQHFQFYLRHDRALTSYNLNHSKVAERRRNMPVIQPKLYHLYGESGVGKSQTIRMVSAASELTMFEPAIGGANVWWDGAQGSEILFLDDFYGGIKFNQLMNLLDGNSTMQLQTKGGFIDKPHWVVIFMTTNFGLETLYPNVDSGRKKGLTRRFQDFGRSIRIPFALDYKYIWEKKWPENLFGTRPDCIPWPVCDACLAKDIPCDCDSLVIEPGKPTKRVTELVTRNEVSNNTGETSSMKTDTPLASDWNQFTPVFDSNNGFSTSPNWLPPLKKKYPGSMHLSIKDWDRMRKDGFSVYIERDGDAWHYLAKEEDLEKWAKYKDDTWGLYDF